MGYLPAAVLQFCFLYGGIFLIMTLLLTFGGFCLFFGAFVTDIHKHLAHINDEIANRNQFRAVNSTKIKKQLYNLIEFHFMTKQYNSFSFNFILVRTLIIF